MAVNFTPFAGLAMPTDSELALNWTRSQDLQGDNNAAIQSLANIDLTSYTPSLISAGSTPAVGTGGSRVGEYRNIHGFIIGSFKISIGSGPTAGTGIYGISLPLEADGAFHALGGALNDTPGDYDIIGTGYMLDNTVTDNSGPAALDLITISAVSYMRFLVSTFVGKSSFAYSPGVPFTIADGDTFTGSFAYRAEP